MPKPRSVLDGTGSDVYYRLLGDEISVRVGSVADLEGLKQRGSLGPVDLVVIPGPTWTIQDLTSWCAAARSVSGQRFCSVHYDIPPEWVHGEDT